MSAIPPAANLDVKKEMIAAGDLQEFVPYGRRYLQQHHPKEISPLQPLNRSPSVPCRTDLGVQLLTALKGVSLKDKEQKCKEKWQIRVAPNSDGIAYEEELYSCGRSVVWSKGNSCHDRYVCKSYTVDYSVQQALWCDMFMANNKPGLIPETSNEDDDGEVQPCVCILDSGNLNFFTNKGQEYVVALPFQVLQVWPMKYGILLERSIMSYEKNTLKRDLDQLPTLFSLLHPLDEITPLIKSGSGLSSSKAGFVHDQQMKVIFTSINPSLIMFYNRSLGVHSVWKIRKAKPDELRTLIKTPNDSNTGNYSHQTTIGTPSVTGSSLSSLSSNTHSRCMSSTFSPLQTSNSPIKNYSGSKGQTPLQSRSQSPSFSGITQMAAICRSQSPSACVGADSCRYQYTPSQSFRSPGIQGNNASLITNETFANENENLKPLSPEICLDLIWMESPTCISNTDDGIASKAFITTDFVEQRYLCYIIPSQNQLRCVKFEESNDNSQFIFGVTTSIAALDAVPLDNCNTMLVLEAGNSLSLYSGVIKVCKVYIPTIPESFSCLETPNRYPVVSSRRSSLVTPSGPSSSMDVHFAEEVRLLSPVPNVQGDSYMVPPYIDEGTCSVNITKFYDPVHNRVTIEFANNSCQRITIPKVVKSSLVELSLEAVRNVLPRDLSVQLFTKWYSTVNTLGSCRDVRSQEWSIFVACLLGLMGYNLEHLTVAKQLEIDLSHSPSTATKKFKSSDGGSDDDWKYLVSSTYNGENIFFHDKLFGTSMSTSPPQNATTSGAINSRAILFPHIPAILFALHLVYEEIKLKVSSWNDLESLAPLLMQLARDLNVNAFVDYYWRDFPQLHISDDQSQVDEIALGNMLYPSFLSAEPPSVFQWINKCLLQQKNQPFPYISNVNSITKTVIILYSVLTHKDNIKSLSLDNFLKKITVAGSRSGSSSTNTITLKTTNESNVHEMLVICMTQLGINSKTLESLPIGIALPLRHAIFQCRRNPPSWWPEETYHLIGREDLSAHVKAAKEKRTRRTTKSKLQMSNNDKKKPALVKDEDDGMENLDEDILKLRFGTDQRIQEVRRLLQSSKPVRVCLNQRPEVSDHDFVEEQERFLYGMCMRTMALPVGRGMFTLHTSHPVVTETLPIPKLCLTGRAPPRNTNVDLSHIDPPANMNVWPLFHNGVAAGLRIAPHASQIDSTWIVYNKPKGTNEMPMEHAGFLMSLGLNGHLKNLSIMNVHDYLCKGHEMTSVGLILGIAAAKRGTMDVATTKLLSIHVEALLPSTSTELDVPHIVQVAAILGVGLVYEGTTHRHISEMLLSEIGRPPGPEMEHSNDRESYSLAAGLALGLVTFGSGNQVAGLLDLSMADQLYHFMVGGHKRSMLGVHKDKYKSPSYQIKEGDAVNIDVTSPGATLALGMMYFRTGNKAVAEWLSAPDTQFLLDLVRPDFLLLRTFSKGLILWDEVYPTTSWVESHIPPLVAENAFKKNRDNDNVDYETMNQAYCNILAGSCMSLGFRFAGTANNEAYTTLMKYVKLFINMTGKQNGEQAGRSTIENCLNVTLISLAMVMAGTGDLEILRICRYLHFRLGQSNNFVLYGSHMANHMALGLVFLGGGRYTLSTKPSAIAVMICAFFPKFPIHSSDNRYHLQAFRHLYVLAVEPRLIIPRDIDSGMACYTNINIKFKDSPWYKNASYNIRAPCFVPELELLEEVSVEDPRYWPIRFHRDSNWKSLKCLLENHGTLYVKQKAGCLSYIEDPRGFRSVVTQSLRKDIAGNWSVMPQAIESFSSDSTVLNFAKHFLLRDASCPQEDELKQIFCAILYECITQEKMDIFLTCVTLLEPLQGIRETSRTHRLWQIKLCLTFSSILVENEHFRCSPDEHLLNPKFALAIQSRLEAQFRQWQKDNPSFLSSYIDNQVKSNCNQLVEFIVYYDIPSSLKFSQGLAQVSNNNLATLCVQLKELNLSTASLMSLISSS